MFNLHLSASNSTFNFGTYDNTTVTAQLAERTVRVRTQRSRDSQHITVSLAHSPCVNTSQPWQSSQHSQPSAQPVIEHITAVAASTSQPAERTNTAQP